jgi:hypothetical protein
MEDAPLGKMDRDNAVGQREHLYHAGGVRRPLSNQTRQQSQDRDLLQTGGSIHSVSGTQGAGRTIRALLFSSALDLPQLSF